jgi:hypothetical protein
MQHLHQHQHDFMQQQVLVYQVQLVQLVNQQVLVHVKLDKVLHQVHMKLQIPIMYHDHQMLNDHLHLHQHMHDLHH